MTEEADFEFVKSIYPFSGEGQAVPLRFAESTVILVVERTEDGWCRGFSCGKEGWFPTSYVKPLANSELIQVSMAFQRLVRTSHRLCHTEHCRLTSCPVFILPLFS